jgi:hypothetical protein
MDCRLAGTPAGQLPVFRQPRRRLQQLRGFFAHPPGTSLAQLNASRSITRGDVMKALMLAAVAAFALAVVPATAAAQTGHVMLKDSPKVQFVVQQPLAVGDTVLKPGTYKFQCRVFDGKTFLVVTMADTGREVVRTPCVREEVDAPIANPSFWTTAGADGVRVLTRVGITGEMVTHKLVSVN